ncbi:MAG TPA: hypothetical protein VJX28_02035 [Chthoniobacterales bacterium]|nr:hypothetical protein [Chthoniobacterales bacterium]
MTWLLMIHIAADNSDEIEDIRPPLPPPPSLTIVILLVVLLLLAIIAYVLWPNVKGSIAPPIPKEVALKRLENAKQRVSSASSYDFGVEVSDILRNFIEQQFGIRAVRQTTSEFLNEASHATYFDLARREKLRQFLVRCDAIKFARVPAGPVENEALFEQASAFVEEVN